MKKATHCKVHCTALHVNKTRLSFRCGYTYICMETLCMW